MKKTLFKVIFYILRVQSLIHIQALKLWIKKIEVIKPTFIRIQKDLIKIDENNLMPVTQILSLNKRINKAYRTININTLMKIKANGKTIEVK